jgi:hypothetical protein
MSIEYCNAICWVSMFRGRDWWEFWITSHTAMHSSLREMLVLSTRYEE